MKLITTIVLMLTLLGHDLVYSLVDDSHLDSISQTSSEDTSEQESSDKSDEVKTTWSQREFRLLDETIAQFARNNYRQQCVVLMPFIEIYSPPPELRNSILA
jgi:hypothetical protein